MRYYLIWTIYWISNVFMSSLSQYAPPYRKIQGNLCDGNKAALVEHFFTVIFSEFRNPPPVCVCVQMCIDQATYCYPNGCLKKMDGKKKRNEEKNQPEDTQIIQVDKNPVFLVDGGSNQFSKVAEEGTTDSTLTTNTEPSYKKGMNLYTFGDNYKKLFKFRKLPKVQLQYNLREQVKSTKSNILTTDVANNRWPSKMKQVSIGKPYQPDVSYEKTVGSAKYFKGMPSVTPRYFKRDLKPSNINAENKNSAQTSEDPEKFSLEKLINDLIESGLDNPENINNGDKDMTQLKSLKEELDSNLAMPIDTDLVLPTQKKEDEIPSNETTNKSDEHSTDITTSSAGLINDTIEMSNNKSYDYYDDQTSQTPKEMFKNVYNDDTIDTLSKSIEKLNNTSYELLNMQTFETITEDTTNAKEDNNTEKVPYNITSESNFENYSNKPGELITATPKN